MRLLSYLSILILAITLTTLSASTAPGTTAPAQPDSPLFTVGVGAGLIGGLYDGFYPYSALKKHGNFGLGAPDKLDGELMIFQGKIYQTQHTGKTFITNDRQLTPFAMINFFHPDITLTPHTTMNKAALFHYLDSVLININGMYAIHISGKFSYIKTRAFPPVKEHDHTPLAEMLSLQKFFEFSSCQGDLIGYRLPSFMDNTNIAGYHFHYLSQQKDAGGHMIELATDNIVIEIQLLNNYTIQLPATKDFEHFDFKKNRENDIKDVERGGKN
jgi:acetolactate decarboxylase